MQMINKKGAVAKTLFYTWFTSLLIETEDEKTNEDVEETIATLVYNCTIEAMYKMLYTPEYIVERCHLTEYNKKRMREDLMDMQRLEYKKNSLNLDLDYCEDLLVDALPIQWPTQTHL